MLPGAHWLRMLTGTGLPLSGARYFTYNSQTTEITLNGTLTSLSNWSLTAGNASGASWQPVTGLTVTPNFSGSIKDNAGSIGLYLSSGTRSPPSVSPDQTCTLSGHSP